jgi:hypothetical protein
MTETRWSGALGNRSSTISLKDEEGMIRETRSIYVEASPSAVFHEFMSIGGEQGWLKLEAAWRFRGAIDRALGGPGLRRGRRHPSEALPGEAIDFWRVEAVEDRKLLRLRSEMRVPGIAWLEWVVQAEGSGSRLVQTAYFVPKGLPGLAYWYSLYPIHRIIFGSLAKAIARNSEKRASAGGELAA